MQHMKANMNPASEDSRLDADNPSRGGLIPCLNTLEGGQNVVLIGGPGTGKTHVATALGMQAIAVLWRKRQRENYHGAPRSQPERNG